MRCNKTTCLYAGMTVTAITEGPSTTSLETRTWQKTCHMPESITGHPGTSPLSPGRFWNVVMVGPFSALHPQARKGCRRSGEVIPKVVRSGVSCTGFDGKNDQVASTRASVMPHDCEASYPRCGFIRPGDLIIGLITSSVFRVYFVVLGVPEIAKRLSTVVSEFATQLLALMK